jgi:hypothetical protein
VASYLLEVRLIRSKNLLFFIDETWQRVGGRDVGALAAVGIPRAFYNAFCREIWQIKKNVLGASELNECEIKGTNCFAKAAFHKRREAGHSKLLQAAEETLAAIPKYHGYAFGIWTTHEEWLLLRNPNPQALSPVYQELLKDFRRCMRTQPGGSQGQLLFDNRGKSEDLSAACAIQNFIVRVSPDWRRRFMQTPHFTLSAVSPGLQAADLIAYLAAHRHDPSVRPELANYWTEVEKIAFRTKRLGLALRAIDSMPPKRKTAPKKGRGRQKPPKRR